jgi:AcrR family transcriptional regulator
MQTREKLRRTPRQTRAQKTVDFILEAAAYILSEDGVERFTTNSVAERAGVNIASLYQYFPNKSGILAELQARHAAAPDESHAQLADRLRHLPLEAAVRVMVGVALDTHAREPAMHKLFLEMLPRQARPNADFEQNRIAKLTSILEPKSRTSRRPDMTMFITRHALRSIVHEAVCERPEWLLEPDFREEIVRLIVNFLGESGASAYGGLPAGRRSNIRPGARRQRPAETPAAGAAPRNHG